MTTRLGWIRNLHFHTTRTPAAFAVACTLGLMAPSALATPEGGTFVTNPTWGQILQSGPAGQTVTNVFLPGANIDPSNRHIINWTSLDLGTQETLNFSGANGYSVMNRIDGIGTPTSINGTLNAMTGNVFIVNNAGIVFGQNATINASGLHAAAANWSNGDAMQVDFLAGAPLTFNTTGDVEFGGTLNASNGVALLGQHVRNTGDISGRYIVMAAGDRIVVEDLGSRFSVMIDGQAMDDLVNAPVAGTVNADITTGDPGVHNSGTVTATHNGSVSLLVGDLLGLAILHDGEIHASGGDVDLLAAGGAIWTSTNNVEVAEAGLILVSDNTQAGTIDISAAAIVLEGSTQANGHAGDISIQGYSNVVMSNGGAVVADGGISTSTADGGTILIRATDGTVWAETGTGLSAKGGLFGGNGGRIEVDGQSVALQAATKLGAISGESGHLVINSNGPVVIDATGDALVAVDETSLSTSILAIGEVGRIGAASGESLSSVDGHLSVTSSDPMRIEASLLGLRETASFTSSEIQVAIADADQRIYATTLSFSGDISLESSVTLSGDDALALLDGNVSGDSTTALTLSSGGSMDLEGDLGAADSKLASVYMETGHALAMVGGHGRAGQHIHASGDVHIGGSNNGLIAATVSEALFVRADGDISIGAAGGALDVTANNNVDIEASGTLTNQAKFDVDGSLRFAGGDVHNAADVLTEQGITMQALTGELHTEGALDTVMDINLASASTLTNGTSMTSEQGSIRLESYQSDVVSLASLSAADLVLLQADNGAVSSMADVQATDVTISAASGVEISGNVEAASSFNAIASVGDIAVSGDTIEGDTLSLTALAGSIDATSSFVGQSVDIAAANNLTITGDVTAATSALAGAGGDLTLTAGNGPLVVTGDLAGTTILLTSTAGEIDATSNMIATTIGFDAGTDLTIAGDITSVDALTLNATDALNYLGNATSQGDVILTGQSITMNNGSLNGAAVEVTSSGAVALTGDVTSDTTISIDAGTDLTIAGDITSVDALTLNATDALNYSGNATSQGDVILTGQSITMTGGSLNGAAVEATSSGAVALTGDVNTPGDLKVTSTSGSVSLDVVTAIDGNILVNAEHDITLAGELSASAIDASSIQGDVSQSGSMVATGEITVNASGGSVVANVIVGQSVDIAAANNLTITGDVTAATSALAGAGGDLTLTAGNGPLVVTGDLAGTTILLTSTAGEIDATSNMTATTIGFDAGTDLTLAGDITAVDALTLNATDALNYSGNATSQGDVILTGQSITMTGGSLNGAAVEATSSGAVALTGDVNTSGDLKVTSTSGSVSLDVVTAIDGNILVNAEHDITLAGELSASAIDASSIQGDVSQSGSMVATGDIAVNASGGSVVANVIVGQSVDIAAANNLTITGDVTAATSALAGAGGDLTLTAGNGPLVVTGDLAGTTILLTSTAGEIDATSNMTATTIGFDAGTDLTLAGDITAVDTLTLNATDALNYSGNATSQGDVILTGQSITMTGGSLNGAAVEATSSGAVALTGDVNTPGDLKVTSTSGSVSLDVVTAIDGNILVNAEHDITLAGELSASAIDASSIQGDVSQSGSMVATGEITVNASGGSVVANVIVGQSVDIAAANNLTITGDVTAATSALAGAGGDLTLTAGNGPLVVTGDLAGTTILLTSTAGEIDATSNMTATTIGFDAGTDLTLAGDITSVDALTLNATDALNYSGNATSQGDVILTGQSITMTGGSLNGAAVEATSSGAVALTGDVNTPGDLKVTSTSGSVSLDVVTAIDGNILVNAEHDITLAGGDLTGGNVSLDAASVQLSGGSIRSTVGNIAVLSDDLSVSGTVHLRSAADLTIAAEQGTGRMQVDGANLHMVAAGDLSLLTTIDGAGGVLSASAGDTLLLGGNVGSDHAVESLNLTGGALVLGGSRDGVMWDLSEVNARGDIGLNTSNLSLLSELPSIYGYGPSLSVRSGEGNITFGGNRGFSYLGDVVLHAARTLAIGDFTTLGDMTLRGETIEVYRRSATMLMSSAGSSESMQTSVVAGGFMTIDGDVQFVGSTGDSPLFGAVGGGSGIPSYDRVSVDAFGASDMTIVVGNSSQPTLKSLAAIVPTGGDDILAAGSQLGENVVQLSGNEDIRTLAVLADLGIELIDAAEVAQPTHHLTAAAEFVNDMSDRGSTMADPTSGLVKITRSRLKDRFVRAAVADYAAALDAATEAGSLESAGLTVREARLEWEAQPGEKTDYRQWLAEGGDPIRERAARILADLDAVYRDLRLAGLTRAEVAASRRFVSAKLAG